MHACTYAQTCTNMPIAIGNGCLAAGNPLMMSSHIPHEELVDELSVYNMKVSNRGQLECLRSYFDFLTITASMQRKLSNFSYSHIYMVATSDQFLFLYWIQKLKHHLESINLSVVQKFILRYYTSDIKRTFIKWTILSELVILTKLPCLWSGLWIVG